MNNKFKVVILILSDRASQGVYEDRSGTKIIELLDLYMIEEPEKIYKIIPDEKEIIEKELKEMAKNGCHLVLTSGGTGPSKRDVTPEATEAVCQKILPGFGELMRRVSFEKVPTAILSRSTAGICGDSLIVNMPGSPKAIKECLEAVFPAIPDCVKIVSGFVMECDETNIKVHKPHHH
ncbi:MAG: molybdopterin adenylyltransferase [Campylobacterales bacterium]|nr:molybdopterin adenylyltransferase [Campylobacterales bacterium]